MQRHGFEPRKALRSGLAHGHGPAAESVCQSIGDHAPQAALIDVMHSGEHDERRTRHPKQPSENVGVKAVAVYQVGAKLAQKCTPANESPEHARGRLAYIEMKGGNRGGPFFMQPRHQHYESDRVAAPGHPFRDSERLLFRPTHAERREQVDDAHGTRTLLDAYLCLNRLSLLEYCPDR